MWVRLMKSGGEPVTCEASWDFQTKHHLQPYQVPDLGNAESLRKLWQSWATGRHMLEDRILVLRQVTGPCFLLSTSVQWGEDEIGFQLQDQMACSRPRSGEADEISHITETQVPWCWVEGKAGRPGVLPSYLAKTDN